MIAAERLSLRRQEHRAVVRLHREFGPRFPDVFLHPRERALSDRDHAVFLPLALADQDRAALGSRS